MLPLIGAILIASLLGSLHCAGMCGAFLALAIAPDERDRARPWMLSVAYNVGRLGTYLILGVLAGLAGQALTETGELAGVQRLAALGAGAFIAAFGLLTLARVLGLRIGRVPLPRAWTHGVASLHRSIAGWSPMARAGGIGLLTTLLPCGWLYAFLATAAGTADPLWAMAAMATFWVGTLPMMAAAGYALQRVTGRARRALPILTALTLVGVGAFTLVGRLDMLAEPGARQKGPICHGQ